MFMKDQLLSTEVVFLISSATSVVGEGDRAGEMDVYEGPAIVNRSCVLNLLSYFCCWRRWRRGSFVGLLIADWIVGLLGDVTGLCPGLCPFHPVLQVELGDRVDQLLWL